MRQGDLQGIPIETLLNMISKSVLFSALDRKGRLSLLEKGRVQIFERGEPIVLEGEKGDSFYLIVEGKVDVYTISDGARLDLAQIGAGDFFGEMSVLQGTPRSATCAAAGTVTVICFDKPVIARILREYPKAKDYILSTMVEREQDNYAKSLESLLSCEESGEKGGESDDCADN